MSNNGKWTTYRVVKVWDRKNGGRVDVRVDMWFDLEAIAQRMGARALENKSGKSKLSGITVEARRI